VPKAIRWAFVILIPPRLRIAISPSRQASFLNVPATLLFRVSMFNEHKRSAVAISLHGNTGPDSFLFLSRAYGKMVPPPSN